MLFFPATLIVAYGVDDDASLANVGRHRASADHAPEPDVGRRSVDRLALPRGRPIAEAVVGGAEVRTSLDDLPRDMRTGLIGHEAVFR